MIVCLAYLAALPAGLASSTQLWDTALGFFLLVHGLEIWPSDEAIIGFSFAPIYQGSWFLLPQAQCLEKYFMFYLPLVPSWFLLEVEISLYTLITFLLLSYCFHMDYRFLLDETYHEHFFIQSIVKNKNIYHYQ